MKIALIGPGIMPIPPTGWGAVEILIWNFYQEINKQGHTAVIINIPNREEIIKIVDEGNFDFVHLHYDVFFDIIPKLKCQNVAITSHYPYIDQFDKHSSDRYTQIFTFLCNNSNFWLFCLCKKDRDVFIKHGARPERTFLLENGVPEESFSFQEIPNYRDRTMCLGKIDIRKRQYLTGNIESVDHYGPGYDQRVHSKGEISREKLQTELTKYPNLVLLSSGESDPLVLKEALMAGLGLVISENLASLFEDQMDFVSVVPESQINNREYIENILKENRTRSIEKRKEIRAYAISRFSFSKKVQDYINIINNQIQSNPVTMVTCFFDINRETQGDGRKISDYLTWIQKTLQLNCNLFVVTEEKFKDFFTRFRRDKIHLVIIDFKQLYYYKYYQRMLEIKNNTKYLQKIAHPNRVECQLPEYNVIQYSKFHCLQLAIESNPFQSEYFFWMDIGTSRFFYDANIQIEYPGKKGLKLLQTHKNKFFIQKRHDLDRFPINDEFIWRSDNLLKGTVFGGRKEVIYKISEKLEQIFRDVMLTHDNYNNEQLGLALVWKENKEDFYLLEDSHTVLFTALL